MQSKSILIIFPEEIIKSEIKWTKYAAPVSTS